MIGSQNKNQAWMLPLQSFGLVVLSVLLGNSQLLADTDTLSYDQLRQVGLEVLWQSQVQTNPSREQVVEMALHVHNDQSRTFYELRYDRFREEVDYEDLDPRGNPFGKNGAKEWVKIRKEILEAEGYEVTVDLQTVAQTTLIALTSTGVVQALDGETGQTRWQKRVGNPAQRSIGVAVNDEYVVAVREGKVYCLNIDDGTLVWERELNGTAGGGVGLSDKHVYVTLYDGSIQMLSLGEIDPLPKMMYSRGLTTDSDPVVTSKTVSWATERGDLNVAQVDRGQRIQYRLRTGFETLAGSQIVGDYLVICSHDGEIHCVIEQEGKLFWKFHTGHNISRRPVGVGEYLLLVFTDQNQLIGLDARNGQILENWPSVIPNIQEYVGASQDLLYFLDTEQNLVGIKQSSGVATLRTPVGDRKLFLHNAKTDRLYLGSNQGSLVCIREVSSKTPLFHGEDDSTNPFDVEDDPFATDEDDPFADEEDPFADDENPFVDSGDSMDGNRDFEDDMDQPGDDVNPFEDPLLNGEGDEDMGDDEDFGDEDFDEDEGDVQPFPSFDPTDPFDTQVDDE